MIGDIITADGFNATGQIDGKGPIPGLVQVSPNNTIQLNAINTWLRTQSKLKTAVLVKAVVTGVGSEDYYTSSLAEAFETRSDIKTYLQDIQSDVSPLDPRAGDTALETIANNLCGRATPPDMVFYAARQSTLPTFLKKLEHRSCHKQPIMVITGSDGAGLRGQDISALNNPDAPISVVYVPLADPAQLDSSDNIHRGLFQEFKKAFTDDHGFPVEHLDTGWAIKSYDAVIAAVTAIRKATENGATLTPKLPELFAVTNQLQLFNTSNVVPGASGNFNIDSLTGDRIYNDTHLLKPNRLPLPIPAPQEPTPQPTP
jgi:hypothetical protein